MSLQAGFAKCDITPALGCAMAGYGARDHGAESLEDPLEARVLVLKNGDSGFAIVCTDLIGVDKGTVADIRAKTGELTDLAPEQVMICGSHTHFGPSLKASGYHTEELKAAVSEDYRLNLVASIAGIVTEACEHTQPARVGYGTGRAWGISFNRRPVNVAERQVAMRLTMEPEQAVLASYEGAKLADAWPKHGHMGPRLTPPLPELDGVSAGIADNEVPILRVDTEAGVPLATLVSFACHAVVNSEHGYAISADYPGQLRWAFERIIGGQVLFAAGCAGDQVPTWRRGNSRQRVGRALGSEAAATWQKIEELTDDPLLGSVSRTVELPLPPDYPTPDQVREKMDAIEDKASPECRWLMYQLVQVEKYHECTTVPREMWAARIGDMGIVCTPGETLVEIGLQLKQRSPFAHTSVISIANDYADYLCTDNAIKEGGYEPGKGYNPSGPGTEAALVENGVDMLQQLYAAGEA